MDNVIITSELFRNYGITEQTMFTEVEYNDIIKLYPDLHNYHIDVCNYNKLKADLDQNIDLLKLTNEYNTGITNETIEINEAIADYSDMLSLVDLSNNTGILLKLMINKELESLQRRLDNLGTLKDISTLESTIVNLESTISNLEISIDTRADTMGITKVVE